MLLKVTHTTELKYSDAVSESVMELRMFPRQEETQKRLSFSLALGPAANVASYFDWLGNTVHTFSINSAYSAIKIIATSVVETERPVVAPETLPDVWPLLLAGNYQFYDYLHFDSPVDDSPALRDLVAQLRVRPGMRLGEVGQRMIRHINDHFEYQTGVTTTSTPISEVLTHRKGVCQDFTHLMIGLARAMGIPARYVSGLVHPDNQTFRGHSQTHAWAELYFPSHGWVGFDPTNSVVVGENFVKVAVGRHYRDVPPNRGLYRGSAKETIDVSVSTDVLHTIPNDLFPEKILRLSNAAPTFNGTAAYRSTNGRQQEHQQQQ